MDNKSLQTNISTGYVELDQAIGQFKTGELIMLAGRPRMGKTSLLLKIGANAAVQHKVLFLSIEHSRASLMKYDDVTFEMDIDDTLNPTVAHIANLVKENKYQLVIIDYLQLFGNEIPFGVSQLKKMATEMNICIVVCAQLSAILEQRPINERRPIFNDLSSTFNHRVDFNLFDKILFLYKEKYYALPSDDVNEDMIELISYIIWSDSYTNLQVKA
jgi:replicative DNA helicase